MAPMSRIDQIVADVCAWLNQPGVQINALAKEMDLAANTLRKLRRGDKNVTAETLERVETERLRRAGSPLRAA